MTALASRGHRSDLILQRQKTAAAPQRARATSLLEQYRLNTEA